MKRFIRIVPASLLLVLMAPSFAYTTVVSSDSTHATAPVRYQGLTREQVQAELHDAYRNGLLHANQNQYPSEYIEHARKQLRVLANDEGKVYPKAMIE